MGGGLGERCRLVAKILTQLFFTSMFKFSMRSLSPSGVKWIKNVRMRDQKMSNLKYWT